MELERITVNVTKRAKNSLDTTAEREYMTKTDVVNRALNAYAFLMELQSEGATVSVQYKDGTKERLRFL